MTASLEHLCWCIDNALYCYPENKKTHFTARIVDNFICNELHHLFQANKATVTSKGNKYILYLIISPRFQISFNAIQLAQLNRMIK